MKRFTPAWLAVCLACSFSTSSLAADALATRAFQGMPADFIKGADISTLLDAEKHGATFYDQNNQRKDPIAILKENGVNYVRLRLWVDPQSASGEGYGGGNNDLATTLTLAKRAKAQGMKLLLDFHYSDFWTDPGKQFKPKAWEKMDYPQLKTAIHDYTRDTIARFKIPCWHWKHSRRCRIWCRSAMRSTAASCGRKGKAGGRGAASSTGWPGC